MPIVEDDILAMSNTDKFDTLNKPTSVNNYSNTQFKDATENSVNNFDIPQPIVEPIRNSYSKVLTASVVPLKENVTQLSSREAIRALIEKDKLESLDMASQAAGVTDLNPNRDKVLKT